MFGAPATGVIAQPGVDRGGHSVNVALTEVFRTQEWLASCGSYTGDVRGAAWLVCAVLAGCRPSPSGVDDDGTESGDEATTAMASTTSATTASPTTSGTTGSSGSTTERASTSSADSTGEAASCNGSPALCNRGYDEVVFAATHNSVAATQSGFAPINANQTKPIADQLADGIRVLLLDVTYDDGETALCHGPCSLGSRPHVEVLAELHTFLVENPREVVSIIYQDSVTPADIEADFENTDLTDLVYTHQGADWPTLGEMIEADTRLVVTAENSGPPPSWYHRIWDLAWDTPYTFTSLDSFSCNHNRGELGHPLFLLNHWLSTEAGLPAASMASQANAADVLLARVAECQRSMGRTPTFIAVDFYEQGDLFEVVQMLNERQSSARRTAGRPWVAGRGDPPAPRRGRSRSPGAAGR